MMGFDSEKTKKEWKTLREWDNNYWLTAFSQFTMFSKALLKIRIINRVLNNSQKAWSHRAEGLVTDKKSFYPFVAILSLFLIL